MNIDTQYIDNLREKVRSKLSHERYAHTLGVENAAVWLGEIFLPDKIDELRCAALLHDIAKEMPYNEQREMFDKGIYSKCDCVDAALHSFVGAMIIQRDFPELATEDIINAVANHTLGSPDMTLFDEIIFISDYIEAGRKYEACISVRRILSEEISKAEGEDEKRRALRRAIYLSLSNTISALEKRGARIAEISKLTKVAYSSLI